MASIGHVVVGMVAARRLRSSTASWSLFSWMVLWSALSLLPDADVIGFRLGVRYGAPFGHRGATHSIVFALAIAASYALLAAQLRVRTPLTQPYEPLRIFLYAAFVLISHPLLDTLTDGGLGCALLWPFSYTRYFSPWRPIPVAPIGRAYWSAAGLRVALTETLLFAPLLLYALWPRRTRAMT